MSNLAMVVGCDEKPFNQKITDEESLRLIKKAGFSKVFLSWNTNGWGETQENIYKLCKALNLKIVFAHLGYRGTHLISNIWKNTSDGDRLVDYIIKDIKELAYHNIKIAVMHTSKSSEEPILCEIGIERFKKIVKACEKYKVTLALENTKWSGTLEYIFDNIQSEYLRVCYDCGHDHLHFKDSFNFDRFKGKIVATHIHDNDQRDDQHLLPFDGNINWNSIIEKLKDADYVNELTCESNYRYGYQIAKPFKFYKEAYKRLEILNKMLKEKQD